MKIKGKGVSGGIAIAPIHRYTRTELNAAKIPIEDVENEIARFNSARTLAAAQIGQLAVNLSETIGEQNSLLFEIHQMMLEDLDYQEAAENIIRSEKACAEYAVCQTAAQFASVFSAMDDEYMKARAADVQDISRRVLEILTGRQGQSKKFAEPVILFSDDFAPSETAQFDRRAVKGLVTKRGSANSHTAIFARTMGIPAVIGVGGTLDEAGDSLMVIIDGDSGEIFLDPSEEVLAEYENLLQKMNEEKKSLQKYIGKPSVTRAGRKIKLYANIGSVADAQLAISNDAEGIGLFRSEFLYLESKNFPSEEYQFEVYRTVAEMMDGKQVIIRTLDIGADKQADYFKLPHEANPALGMRGIRICLTRPEVFKTQIRAILRASAYGKVAVMLPMIISLSEVVRAKAIIQEARDELEGENIAFDREMEVGIMIETPAASIISDLLAKEVDFFSIGTNDLTQYTLAIDRMNEAANQFCDIHHEAVLRQIALVTQNAHQNNIWVGICGELGADPALTERFVQMGVNELSVNPSSILSLRAKVISL